MSAGSTPRPRASSFSRATATSPSSLTHPRYKVEKEYEVTLDKLWDPKLAEKLRRWNFSRRQTRPARAGATIRPDQLRVVLQQGLNRQIRRMFYELGYEVTRLVRTRLGNLRLGEMPRGAWRSLTKSELKAL